MRVGIDLGGTKIEIVAMDDQGDIVFKKREPTKRGSYEQILPQLTELVLSVELELALNYLPVGMGIPGSISQRTGLVRNANTTELNGQPLRKDLSESLKRDVVITNDANCLALSEATDGAGAGMQTVFAVIVGTGTGGGLAINGQVIEGANGIAGEWGHNPLPWMAPEEYPGPDCFCGKQGCIETFLSGPGMQNDYFRNIGVSLSAKEIADQASKGAADAMTTIERYLDRMARALAHVSNILDPDIFVVGGGLSKLPEIYDQVPELMRKYVFADQFDVKIAAAKYGDSSGVRGAAWLSTRSAS